VSARESEGNTFYVVQGEGVAGGGRAARRASRPRPARALRARLVASRAAVGNNEEEENKRKRVSSSRRRENGARAAVSALHNNCYRTSPCLRTSLYCAGGGGGEDIKAGIFRVRARFAAVGGRAVRRSSPCLRTSLYSAFRAGGGGRVNWALILF